MRGLLVVSAIAATGCSSILGIDDFKLGDAGGGGNEGVAQDAGEFCLGPAGWLVCLPAAPTMPLMITNPTEINTDLSPLCLPDQPVSWKMANQSNACFIVATSISLNAPTPIQVIGARPLVLVAADTIKIEGGGLDASSHGTNLRGPGATDAGCMPPTAAQDGPNGTTAAGGGGAGGTLTSSGGRGGSSSSTGIAGGSPAAPVPPSALAVLRAGCSAGGGGLSGNGAAGGRGAPGGGAVYLLAGTMITLNAAINASGAGGQPGGLLGGGGGGGSGGMIVLHAPTIGSMMGRGIVMANGGGGASGSGPQLAGKPGDDPSPGFPTAQANGGVSPDNGGGAGGLGFGGAALATAGTVGSPTTAHAGGGGGGGGGYIRSSNALDNGVISSPAPVVTQ